MNLPFVFQQEVEANNFENCVLKEPICHIPEGSKFGLIIFDSINACLLLYKDLGDISPLHVISIKYEYSFDPDMN